MGNVIKIKHGSTDPLESQLTQYELGICKGYLFVGSDATGLDDDGKVDTKAFCEKIKAGSADSATYASSAGTATSATSATSATTATSAGKWTTAKGFITNLGLTTAASVDGSGSGNASLGVTGVLSISNGGTGANTAQNAATNLISGKNIAPATIQVGAEKYYTSSTASGDVYGINMNNSDIIGVNGIWFGDAADSASEGIHFCRSTSAATISSTWDTLWANNGELYLSKNCGLTGTRGTTDKVFVYNTTDGGTISAPLTLTGGGDVDKSSSTNSPALVIKPNLTGHNYQLNFDGNEILCRYGDAETNGTNDGKLRPLWINGIAVGSPAYGTSAPSNTTFDEVTNGQIYFQVVTTS